MEAKTKEKLEKAFVTFRKVVAKESGKTINTILIPWSKIGKNTTFIDVLKSDKDLAKLVDNKLNRIIEDNVKEILVIRPFKKGCIKVFLKSEYDKLVDTPKEKKSKPKITLSELEAMLK